VPTGAGQLDNFLAFTGPPYYAHNSWDLIQIYAFGTGGNPTAGYDEVNTNGTGNTPYSYGSAVAGPDTHYAYEVVFDPQCSNGIDDDLDGFIDYGGGGGNDAECASSLDNDETAAADGVIGPWQRIRYDGSEIGRGDATECADCCATASPPATCEGQTGFIRVGIPTSAGWDLSPDNPLPAGTNAVRFAVGELIVGEEYFAEVSLRVMDLPLDPNFPGDVNCSEVFGGDAASPQTGQDNTWRYYLPSPACVVLNNFFELSVDKLIAEGSETLTYKIEGKNLSVNPQTNVVVTATFIPGDVNIGSLVVLQGGAPTVGATTLTWTLGDLQPGDEYVLEYQINVAANPGGLSTLHKANYQSTELGAPGFTVVALTDIENIVVGAVAMAPLTPSVAAGDIVRYQARFTNNGTGDATFNGASFWRVSLPTGLTFCGTPTCTTPTVRSYDAADALTGGGNAANPTATAGTGVTYYRFTSFGGATTVLRRGGYLLLEFDVQVDPTAVGLYQSDFQVQVRDNGIGRDMEIFVNHTADLLVDIARSDTPTLDEPIYPFATTVSGNTSEGAGATIVVAINGVSLPGVVAGAGGDFTVTVPSLYAGQGISATAQASGEVVSLPSAEVFVEGTGNVITFCNDGVDNDGDGFADFPDDLGCTSPLDVDETDVPQCSDSVDNDGDGATDFPDDPGCSSYVDNDEAGVAACGDGADNDGDGATDFPDDPGCSASDDVNEADVPQCANGGDDDSDLLVDYPFDPGCSSPADDDEGDVAPGGDAGADAASASDASVGNDAGLGEDAGNPADPGGLEEPSGGGCCGVNGGTPASSIVLSLLCLLLLTRRRRWNV
jgi:hypothetical protein